MSVVWVVTAAVLLGVVLAGYVLREMRPPSLLAAGHGVVGFLGVIWLVSIAARLGDPARGTGGFAGEAEGFLAVALLGGLAVAWMGWRGRRPPFWLVAAHAAAGVCGWALLAAI